MLNWRNCSGSIMPKAGGPLSQPHSIAASNATAARRNGMLRDIRATHRRWHDRRSRRYGHIVGIDSEGRLGLASLMGWESREWSTHGIPDPLVPARELGDDRSGCDRRCGGYRFPGSAGDGREARRLVPVVTHGSDPPVVGVENEVWVLCFPERPEFAGTDPKGCGACHR